MLPQSSRAETELSDLLEIVWRRKWLIALCTVIVGVGAYVLTSRQTEKYEATASVLLRGSETADVLGSGSATRQQSGRDLSNEIAFIQSDQMRAAIAERVGGPARVSPGTQGDSDVLTFRAEGTSPARVAEIANVAAEVYIEERADRVLQDYLTATAAIQEQLATVVTDKDTLVAPVEAFRATLDPNETDEFGVPVNSDAQIATYTAELAQLEAGINGELQRLEAAETTLRTTLGNLELENQLAVDGSAQIITEARVPTSPFSPNVVQNSLIGVVGGLLLGLAIALLVEYFDRRIRTADEVHRVTQRPVLASVPYRPRRGLRRQATKLLPVVDEPGSLAAEAYRSLWSSIEFQAQSQPLRTILVTSSSPGEGKTTVTANLAITLAQAGRSVIVVDADLRRPRMHEMFDLENDIGFSSVGVPPEFRASALKSVEGLRDLRVLTAGETANPPEFLASDTVSDVLADLRERCDYLLIDSSPVLPATDPLILAARCDAAIMVCRAGETSDQELRTAFDRVDERVPVVGLVLNSVRKQSKRHEYYGPLVTPTEASSNGGSPQAARPASSRN